MVPTNRLELRFGYTQLLVEIGELGPRFKSRGPRPRGLGKTKRLADLLDPLLPRWLR